MDGVENRSAASMQLVLLNVATLGGSRRYQTKKVKVMYGALLDEFRLCSCTQNFETRPVFVRKELRKSILVRTRPLRS